MTNIIRSKRIFSHKFKWYKKYLNPILIKNKIDFIMNQVNVIKYSNFDASIFLNKKGIEFPDKEGLIEKYESINEVSKNINNKIVFMMKFNGSVSGSTRFYNSRATYFYDNKLTSDFSNVDQIKIMCDKYYDICLIKLKAFDNIAITI